MERPRVLTCLLRQALKDEQIREAGFRDQCETSNCSYTDEGVPKEKQFFERLYSGTATLKLLATD